MRKGIRVVSKANRKVNEFNRLICAFAKHIVWLISTVKMGIKKSRYTKHTGYSYFGLINHIGNLSPRQFEIFCYELYKALGYKCTLTQATNDFGRDVIIKKDGKTFFIECKHYSKNNKVTRDVCLKLLGSVSTFNADGGIVISTGDFTRPCYELSNRVDNLELVGYTDIMDLLFNLSPMAVNRIIGQIKVA